METSTKRKASADLQHEEESLKVNKKSKDLIANDSSEDQASTNVPGQPQRIDVKQKMNTTPIHRGRFKSKWLSKHSSLLKRSRNAYGLLISCVVGCETRALGQAQQFLLHYIPKFFPGYQSTWERIEDDLEIDESIVGLNTKDYDSAQNGEQKTGEEKKDKVLEAVDCGCSGLVFLRFRINVTPTDFIQKLIGHLLSLSVEDRQKELQRISYCSRWIPMDYICNSFEEDIAKTFETIKDDHFNNEKALHQKVAIVSEVRNNERLKKPDIIKAIAPSLPSTLKVNLTSPDVVIFVSVFKSVCGMSVLPRYYELKKYNISSICS